MPGGSDRPDTDDVAQELPLVVRSPAPVSAAGPAAHPAAHPAARSVKAKASKVPVAEAPADPPAAHVEPRRASRPGKERPIVPTFASGRYEVASGTSKISGDGAPVRYLVEMEKGLPFDVDEFATEVARILNAPGGWGHGGKKYRFQRVDKGPVRFRVSLSSPGLTDSQCAPLRTYGKVSCFNGVRSVINAERWAHGAPTYPHDLPGYREYVISHEVGHAMGKDHVGCPHHGEPAPVMVQQTKSLEGCTANPWPFPAEATKD